MTTKDAIDYFREQFEKDPDFRSGYQSNIAMAFYDAYNNAARKNRQKATKAKGLKHCPECKQQNRGSNRECFRCKTPLPNTTHLDIKKIANEAANNFLDLWLKK